MTSNKTKRTFLTYVGTDKNCRERNMRAMIKNVGLIYKELSVPGTNVPEIDKRGTSVYRKKADPGELSCRILSFSSHTYDPTYKRRYILLIPILFYVKVRP